MDVSWSAALDGAVRAANYTLAPAGPGVLATAYRLFSLPVEERYYILDFTEDGSFLLYFYCGTLLGSEYSGAVSRALLRCTQAPRARPGPSGQVPPLPPPGQAGPAPAQRGLAAGAAPGLRMAAAPHAWQHCPPSKLAGPFSPLWGPLWLPASPMERAFP